MVGSVYPPEITKEYVAKAQRREAQGLTVYGDFNPLKDKRVMSVEAQDECVDIFNYMEFLIRKFPQHKSKARKVQVKACVVYQLLKQLEEVELSTHKKGGTV